MKNIFYFTTLFLFMAGFGSAFAQSTSNVQASFSCVTGKTTVTYDLTTQCHTDVTLYYSHDKINWLLAQTVSGNLTSQTTGTGKTIVWDNTADQVQYGKFYFKVETEDCGCPEDDCVMIGGVCWATCNLASRGRFVCNPEDYGALFQWGRKGDGHEQRTSPSYPTNNMSIENGCVSGTANFDANGQIVSSHAAYGKFIKTNSNYGNYGDWRTPQDNALWNAGTETAPIKTANDPCPVGWRVPTRNELSSLASSYPRVSATINGVNGYLFGSGVNTIFMPAAGHRYSPYGTIMEGSSMYGQDGLYWSSTEYWISTEYGQSSYYMSFSNLTVYAIGYRPRAHGFSVRCVAE